MRLDPAHFAAQAFGAPTVTNPAFARAAAERLDEATVAAARAEPGAGALLLCGDAPVLRPLGEGPPLARHPLDALPAAPLAPPLLLGREGGAPLFAARVAGGEAERLKAEGLLVVDLRSVAAQGLVPPGPLAALGLAKSLLDWHARHGHCANCGAATLPAAGGWRRACPACAAEHYPRTDPVAIMLVERGDAALLGRAPRFAPGVYSCLAGFVEPGEALEDAVRREVFEEAGVPVGAVTYAASQPWPFPHSLMLGCRAEALADALVLDRDELEDARWFPRAEVARMLAGDHPQGLRVPPPLAIAHGLVRGWATGA